MKTCFFISLLTVGVLAPSHAMAEWTIPKECKGSTYYDEGSTLFDRLRASCKDTGDLEKYDEYTKAIASFAKFETTYAACIRFRDTDPYKMERKKARAFRKVASKIKHPFSANNGKSFLACRSKFKETYAEDYKKDLDALDEEKKSLAGSDERKAWGEALTKLEYPRKKLLALKIGAKSLGSDKERKAIDQRLKVLEGVAEGYRAKLLEELRAKKCPAGKKKNKKLAKKLGKVYDNWVKRHTPGKSKRMVLRMDGKVVKETLVNGRRETANTILCYRDLTKTEEPSCHYDKLSFSRTKPNGAKWGPWTRGGAGENGPLFCDNVK